MSWIVAISNQKGGVGKTTTCISLGAYLANAGQPTLIVDLDSQANLTFATGFDPDTVELAIPDLLEDSDNLLYMNTDLILHTSVPGLDILPSDVRLAAAEQSLFSKEGYEKSLLNSLAPFRDKYAFILIDCPPSLSALTLIALTAAELVLVPVQCEYYSARGLLRLIDVVEAVQKHTNPTLDYRLVVTMFDRRNKISFQVYDQIIQNYQDKIFETIIGVDTKLKESAVVGEPILTYAPSSRSAKAYKQLALELISFTRTKGAK